MTHNTPAPVADKALAERLARLLGGEHEAEADGDYDTADLDQACGNAFRSGQLITLAEAQAMVVICRKEAAMPNHDHSTQTSPPYTDILSAALSCRLTYHSDGLRPVLWLTAGCFPRGWHIIARQQLSQRAW